MIEYAIIAVSCYTIAGLLLAIWANVVSVRRGFAPFDRTETAVMIAVWPLVVSWIAQDWIENG